MSNFSRSGHLKEFDFKASQAALNSAWNRLRTNNCAYNELLGLIALDRGKYFENSKDISASFDCLTNAYFHLTQAYGLDDSRLKSIEQDIKTIKSKLNSTQHAPPGGRGEAPRP